MRDSSICVSVCAERLDELISLVAAARSDADVIEVRFDCLEPRVLELVGWDTIREGLLAAAAGKQLLFTYRSPEQGGTRSITLDERTAFWSRRFDGIWVDVEEDVQQLPRDHSKKIVSYHDFSGVPSDLERICRRIADSDADMVKIAVTVEDAHEAIPVWDLLRERGTVIPIAMGEAGKWTRILAPAFGSPLTYGSLSGRETAPGQFTGQQLRQLYGVHRLSPRTKVYGVIGDPVTTSRSPVMHNAAFRHLGIDAVFLPMTVKNMAEFFRRMVRVDTREVDINFAGFSVTMPHKLTVIPLLDEIDPIAAAIGAVNTVKCDGERLIGSNTDAPGFIEPLKRLMPELAGIRVALFGSGGAAKACIHALHAEGANVTVIARDSKKAMASLHDVEVAPKGTSLSGFDVVVNATPLGMRGPYEKESPCSAAELDGVRLAYDLVTRDGTTAFLKEAQRAGIPSIGGIEMLIEQGARQFEIWTGHTAPVEVMRKAIIETL